jgi:hypothetical protein
MTEGLHRCLCTVEHKHGANMSAQVPGILVPSEPTHEAIGEVSIKGAFLSIRKGVACCAVT